MSNHWEKNQTAQLDFSQNKQVAQGQYVVSDTRCPALSDCELEWGEAGQRPQRGQSPIEHRGTFIFPFIRSSVGPPLPHPQGFVSFEAYSDPNSTK